MSGCANSNVQLDDYPCNNYYIKKDNLAFFQPKDAEFYDLKDYISKQGYRRLPSYLQDCYEHK